MIEVNSGFESVLKRVLSCPVGGHVNCDKLYGKQFDNCVRNLFKI